MGGLPSCVGVGFPRHWPAGADQSKWRWPLPGSSGIQSDMRRYLEAALDAHGATQAQASSESVNIDPKEPENWPHITTTNQLLNLKDTVIASGKSSPSRVSSGENQPSSGFASRVDTDRTTNVQQRPGKVRTDSGSLLKITPMELIKLAPRLKPYLEQPGAELARDRGRRGLAPR